MRLVAYIMGTVLTNAVVVASKQLNRVGVIRASIARIQPVLFWDAQLVSKPDDC